VIFLGVAVATAVVTRRRCCAPGGEVACHEFTGIGEVLPGAGDAADVGLAAELSFVPTSRATRVTSEANEPS
jgi:hypothetical protein